MSDTDCPFCARIARGEFDHDPTRDVFGVVNFEPLNPVTPGHRLFVPYWHHEHPSPGWLGPCMNVAEDHAGRQGEAYNLITSSGVAATMTIPHLHVHYVPRRDGDGLRLPWTVADERPEANR